LQLSGYGRNDWSTWLTHGLSTEEATGFQSRRGRRREATPVTLQYAAFETYKAAQIASKLTKIPAERFSWLFTEQDYARNGNLMPDMKALQANVDSTQALGFIKNKLDVQKYTDLSLIQEAAARLK
jgi:hypothetical protein